MKNAKLTAAAAMVATAAVLAGCGGGGDSLPPPTSQVPATASVSVAGFISYIQALVASPADTLEPVDVSTLVPPKDETSEPTPVD
ncbi:MAG: hypothetical protein M3O01_09630 [Pseudomonadota bacterium]|nr:hypothetical protein [Pseudomonadota bacterium]